MVKTSSCLAKFMGGLDISVRYNSYRIHSAYFYVCFMVYFYAVANRSKQLLFSITDFTFSDRLSGPVGKVSDFRLCFFEAGGLGKKV